MKRDQALEVLARCYPDGIVVAVYQSAFDWIEIRPHDLNYLCTGAMGQASSHALGLALGAPDEKIVVLDGDGSLLMNLGSLVTIAAQKPRNFYHFVCRNNTYEVNGNFPIPGADSLRFDEMARAAGYPHAFSFRELNHFKAEVGRILKLEGPVFISLHVEPGVSFPRNYEKVHSAKARAAFRRALYRRMNRKERL